MKKKLTLILVVVAIIATAVMWTSLAGTVDFKEYHVKQAFYTGEMTVIDEPGVYGKFFGNIKSYDRAHMFYFSKDQLDGGTGAESQALIATFMGNSTADVSGICKYVLPTSKDHRLNIHRTYGSDASVKMELMRNAIAGALKQTGPMFRPEEAFITKRAQFTNLVRRQLEEGLFATVTTVKERKEVDTEASDGNETKYKIIRETVTELKLVDGKPVIERPSVLADNGIVITDFVIKEFDFDDVTDKNIKLKKEAEQIMVVAKANAEKSKQEAITAKMEGDAKIAVAKANEEVIKIQAVTKAEKDLAVATLQADQSKQIARKIKLEGEAKAYSAKLLVNAGLTPLKKAQIEKETRIGVAQALATWKGPNIVMSGSGGGSGGGLGEAMQIKYLMDIDDSYSKKNKITP